MRHICHQSKPKGGYLPASLSQPTGILPAEQSQQNPAKTRKRIGSHANLCGHPGMTFSTLCLPTPLRASGCNALSPLKASGNVTSIWQSMSVVRKAVFTSQCSNLRPKRATPTMKARKDATAGTDAWTSLKCKPCFIMKHCITTLALNEPGSFFDC